MSTEEVVIAFAVWFAACGLAFLVFWLIDRRDRRRLQRNFNRSVVEPQKKDPPANGGIVKYGGDKLP